jgi:hypothetical protein
MHPIRVALVLVLCASLSDHMAGSITGDADSTQGEHVVTIAATSFGVKEGALELQYEIVNGSDHDIWLCTGIEVSRYGLVPYEVYVDPDGRTLVIRRRLAVPMQVLRELQRLDGCYVRLAPGQKRVETYTSGLPVRAGTVFALEGPGVAYASRLVLEIGYYDKALPARIRSILEVADKLKCTIPSWNEMTNENIEVFHKYFSGLVISRDIEGLDGFSKFWSEGSERVNIPWGWPIHNLEESSLKIVLDGVSIRMGG